MMMIVIVIVIVRKELDLSVGHTPELVIQDEQHAITGLVHATEQETSSQEGVYGQVGDNVLENFIWQ